LQFNRASIGYVLIRWTEPWYLEYL